MDFNVSVLHKLATPGPYRTDMNILPKAAVVASADSKPLTVETIDNHVYFYSEVDTDRCLDLIRQIRMVDDRLVNERASRELPDEHRVPIWLHINSGGGDGFTGRAVADQLKRIQSPIWTIVEGYCASAATFISMVGTRRFILPSSFMLIHQASSWKFGSFTYTEMQDEMALFDKFMEGVTAFYVDRSKMTLEQVKEALKRDTWMNAQEALENGLVDEIRV